MGLVTHTAGFQAVAVTAAQDFFEVKASASSILIVHGFSLFQTTDLGDAQEEVLRLATARGSGTVTSGSGGSTATAALLARANTAFGGTVEVNNTTQLAVGTGTLTSGMENIGWNIRIPLNFWWTPETRPIILPAEYWTLGLVAAPADSITVSGTIYLEQVGV